MPARSRRSPRTAAVAVAGALLLLLTAATAPAIAADPQVRVAMQPAAVPAGAAGATVTAVLSNPRGAVRIGSASLTPPSGFSVTNARILGEGTASTPGGTAQLRGLSLAAGATLTVTLTVQAPCRMTSSTAWAVQVKRSRDLTGADLGIAADSTATTGLRGACTVRWDRQPSDTRLGVAVTSVRYPVTASPLTARVGVHDGDGARVAYPLERVGLAFVSRAGAGVLPQRSWSFAASDGFASFDGLTVSAVGTYSLRATVLSGRFGGTASAASTSFRVDDKVEQCVRNVACPPGRLRSGDALFGVDAVAGDDAPFLTLSADAGIQLDERHCPGWTPLTDATALFNVDSKTRAKVISLTVDKTAMNAESDNGAPRLDICFASPVAFYPKNSTTKTEAYPGLLFDWNLDGTDDPVYTGLLPDCPTRESQPCVTQRKKVNAGDGYIQASVPPGLTDPAMRT